MTHGRMDRHFVVACLHRSQFSIETISSNATLVVTTQFSSVSLFPEHKIYKCPENGSRVFLPSALIMNGSDFLHSTASTVHSYTGYSWTTAVGLPLVIAVVLLVRAFQTNNKLPPGPAGLPILGNLLQLSNRPWLQFTEWTKKYGGIPLAYFSFVCCLHETWFASAGPMFRINMAGQNIVVIGSHRIATELFDRRSNIYSDRARNIVAGELLCGGLVIAFSQHNEIWKRMRRGAHE